MTSTHASAPTPFAPDAPGVVDPDAPAPDAPEPDDSALDADPSDAPAVLGPLTLVLLVVAAAVVVTITAGGTQVLQPRMILDEGWTKGLRIAGVGMALLGLVALFLQRRRIRAVAPKGPDPVVVGMRTAGTLMVAVTLLALFNPPERRYWNPTRRVLPIPTGSSFGQGGPGSPGIESRTRGSGSSPLRGNPRAGRLDPARLGFAMPAEPTPMQRVMGHLARIAFIFLVVMVLWRLARRMGPRETEFTWELPLPPARAREGLEESLAEVVETGDDPRGQITRAYLRLLDTLAAAGAPREPHEAPHEHLYRTLGPLGVRPEPLHQLTSLYVLAQFGPRTVTEEHRASAVDALESSLADLRVHVLRSVDATSDPAHAPPVARGPQEAHA